MAGAVAERKIAIKIPIHSNTHPCLTDTFLTTSPTSWIPACQGLTWKELIDYLEQLKYAVAGRASAQRNVMFEYQNEAFESFLDTEKAVKCNIIRNILLSDVKIGKDGRLQVIYP